MFLAEIFLIQTAGKAPLLWAFSLSLESGVWSDGYIDHRKYGVLGSAELLVNALKEYSEPI